MSYFSVDVESDGPCPGIHSMVSFGAIVVEGSLNRKFYGEVKPVSDIFVPEALAISGFSREDHESFEYPEIVMPKFADWIEKTSIGRPIFVSDNLAYDWMFINYYLHKYAGRNPFGHSGMNICDLYSGMERDVGKRNDWRKYRVSKHTHNALDDAKGNAEALLALSRLDLKIKLI